VARSQEYSEIEKMKSQVRVWVALGLLYAVLLAWHQPLRGPLTEQEVRAAFGEHFSQIREAEDARAEALIDFFLTDDGRPFYMVNLNALPEGEGPEDASRIRDAARDYAAFMAPRLLSRASYPVLSTDPFTSLNNSIGTDLGQIDRVVVVRYRSRRDFLSIVTTPAFREAVEHKYASLAGWYSAPAPVGSVISLPQIALAALMVIGLLVSLLDRYRSIRGGAAAHHAGRGT